MTHMPPDTRASSVSTRTFHPLRLPRRLRPGTSALAAAGTASRTPRSIAGPVRSRTAAPRLPSPSIAARRCLARRQAGPVVAQGREDSTGWPSARRPSRSRGSRHASRSGRRRCCQPSRRARPSQTCTTSIARTFSSTARRGISASSRLPIAIRRVMGACSLDTVDMRANTG